MKKIYITSTLNVVPWKENAEKRFDNDWINYRINIFMKYTLESLKAQTNQNFTAAFIYLDETENTVLESLSKYKKLPGNIRFVKMSDSKADMMSGIKDYEYLYKVRLDSDDMYHKSFVEELYDYNPREETLALINQNGYLYHTADKFLIEWGSISSNFYTMLYKTKDLLTGNLDKYKVVGGHPNVHKLPHEVFSKRSFIRTIHSNNTIDYSRFEASNKMAIKDKSKVEKILFEFMGDASYKL